MDPPVVPMSRRNRERMVRDYTIDEEDLERMEEPRPSLSAPTSPEEPAPPVENFYQDRSMSRATAGSIVTQIRDEGNDNVPIPLPDENLDDDLNVNGRPGTNSKAQSYKSSIVRTESQRQELRNFDFNLNHSVNPSSSSYANSIVSASVSQAPSQTTGITSTAESRLPDFFSSETFQTVLHNPTTSHQLLLFSQSRLCGENMEFLEKVKKYHDVLDEVTRTMFEIHKEFLSSGGSSEINISESLLLQVRKEMKQSLTTMLPRFEIVFDDCSAEIERLVATDIYPRFVRHQMVISASKALATDRTKYAGLGDCFVLTNPTKADNPIVYVSDGFAKVTGYARHEIIPRNCRFLQGRQTDRSAVKRLRVSIDNGQESVELLLNYKKTGEPFWNLLYVTPLYDYEGRLAFFLGGQINCSTTIHNASDILRILAYSEDEDEEPRTPNANLQPTSKPGPTNFFKRFRTQKPVVPHTEPGMETGLLNRIEKLNLGNQMTEFYTAYSKFIVVNAVTNFISFHSYGIIALLYPAKPQKTTGTPDYYPENVNVVRPRPSFVPGGPFAPQQQQQPPVTYVGTGPVQSVAGQDIFKFLIQHTQNTLPRDFKSIVKNAMRVGQAVSLELTLCTRRRMGFEKFVTHWTPLKDDVGRTEFMVLTLGSVEQ